MEKAQIGLSKLPISGLYEYLDYQGKLLLMYTFCHSQTFQSFSK